MYSESVDISFQNVKPERNKEYKIHGLLGAKFFDTKVPARKKLKWLNRLASVQTDGTVQFEVPDEVKPQNLDLGVDTTGASEDHDFDATTIPEFPPLQIVMLIVGTRGDVQPFVAIGKRLQEYGHRVRLATHSNFKEFVKASGLVILKSLLAVRTHTPVAVRIHDMVKNKGFLPSEPSEIHIQRSQIKDIVFSLLPACTNDDPDTHVPFNVDAIIANPPAYGHTHVAEALKVPLHIFFTMPWTYVSSIASFCFMRAPLLLMFSLCLFRPTSEFPHPLSRVRQPVANRLSYQIVDALIWMGMRDIINEFRKKKLKLRPVTYLSNSNNSPHDLPHGYIWSPHLVPNQKVRLNLYVNQPVIDWGPQIDVVGFCFLDLALSFVPPDSLVEWLQKGEKPIYIGFGSLTQALESTKQRGIINKGLGNLAKSKDFVYLLDNVPHDWLFLQCSAVVHHGGAGTTAAGLKAACVVPFFGDQPFWGRQVHAKGVGPPPIPVEEFSLKKLISAIHFMLQPEVSSYNFNVLDMITYL
ncbi:putative sterol 3-beta-glucosyltransferase [Helianthus annuus]|nr:putative sterol 3-beta-glucosyltransferase [Helianthus annuus]